MNKIVAVDPRAEKELRKFSLGVRSEFDSLIYVLKTQGRLILPQGKKITSRLFEIRVKFGGIYRGIYAYIGADGIIILHFFRKKSQKIPIKSVKLAERRFRDYEQN